MAPELLEQMMAVRQRLCADLRTLGVGDGDVIMVHSSFKSLGPVPGGIETVIQGLLAAVGALGTLLMPGLSWTIQPGEIFDPTATPVIVGAIPNTFRSYPGVRRSLHPTHSVCGLGARAEDLLADHLHDITPCGMHSPFHKLADVGGKIVMLGCGLRPNTTMHALEESIEPPYLFGDWRVYTLQMPDGCLLQKEYRVHNFKGWEQRYDRVALLESQAFMRRGQVLNAETYTIDVQGLRTAVLEKLRQEPLFFVDPIRE